MNSAERRFTWALIAGAVATGFGAADTNAPLFNLLVGIAWGVPIFIAAWGLLELLHYLGEVRDPSGSFKSERPRVSNVHVIYGDRERQQ